MISRISTALAQFIKPIGPSLTRVNSPPRESPRQNSSGGFERFKKPSPQPEEMANAPQKEQAEAQIIPFPQKAAAESVGATQSFLQLFTLFRGKPARMMNWLGSRTYRMAANQGKRGTRILKGAMLDQKAE